MRILIAAASLCLAAAGCAPLPPAAEPVAAISPAETATAFLDAFNALDEERFDSFFADDVTMFFPAGPFPSGRIEGKAAVTSSFHRFFAMAKKRGATRLNIRPARMSTQDYGSFVIVSFELDGDDNLGRRSLVFRRDGPSLRIVHFHASSVKRDGQAPGDGRQNP